MPLSLVHLSILLLASARAQDDGSSEEQGSQETAEGETPPPQEEAGGLEEGPPGVPEASPGAEGGEAQGAEGGEAPAEEGGESPGEEGQEGSEGSEYEVEVDDEIRQPVFEPLDGMEIGEAPKFSAGAGVGIANVLHVDGSYWIDANQTVDLSVTPLIILNTINVAYTYHWTFLEEENVRHSGLVGGGTSLYIEFVDMAPLVTWGAGGGYGYFSETWDIRLMLHNSLGIRREGEGKNKTNKLMFVPEYKLTWSRNFW